MMRAFIAVLLLWACAAQAGQVQNPIQAPVTITPGHVYVAGSNPQQAADGGIPGAVFGVPGTTGTGTINGYSSGGAANNPDGQLTINGGSTATPLYGTMGVIAASIHLETSDGSIQASTGFRPGAVNQAQLLGGLSGTGPSLLATDGNPGGGVAVPLNLTAQNAGFVNFLNGYSTTPLLSVGVLSAQPTYPVLHPYLNSQGAQSIALAIPPTASFSLIAPNVGSGPTTLFGNGSVDLQSCIPADGTRVASGQSAFAFGCSNTAFGSYSVAGGNFSTTVASFALAFGNSAAANNAYDVSIGQRASDLAQIAALSFSGGNNNAPISGLASEFQLVHLRAKLSGTSATRITADGGAVSSTNSIALTDNSGVGLSHCDMVVAQSSTINAAYFYLDHAAVRRGTGAATTTASATSWSAGPTIGTITPTITPTFAADTTNGNVNISVSADSGWNVTVVCLTIRDTE